MDEFNDIEEVESVPKKRIRFRNIILIILITIIMNKIIKIIISIMAKIIILIIIGIITNILEEEKEFYLLKNLDSLKNY